MGFFNSQSKDFLNKDSLIHSLEKIRAGNNNFRQKFFEDNSNFILKTVSQTLGKSIITKNSEEYNIGLSAFGSAIDDYDINGSEEFFTYSEKVIKKWIYDYSIQNLKNIKIQTSTYYNKDENINSYVNAENLEEIALFKQSLWKFGKTLKELSLRTPENPQAVKLSLDAAKSISQNDEIFNKFTLSKTIPAEILEKELIDYKNITKKYNDYIFALCLIMRSNLEVLKGYIKNNEMNWDIYENVGIVLEVSDNKAVVFTEKCRFVTIKNKTRLGVGREIKSKNLNKSNHIGMIVKYSLYVACFCAALIGILISVEYLSPNDLNNGHLENKQVSVNNTDTDKKSEEKSETTVQEKNTSLEKNNSTNQIPKTPKKENSENSLPSPSIKTIQVVIITPSQFKDFNTPIIPAVAVSEQNNSPTPLPTVTQEKQPTPKSGSVSYSTVKATGAPSIPRISSDFYEIKTGEELTITMKTYGGNNGTMWKLYENDSVVLTINCTDDSPNDQMMRRLITAKKAGVYTYRCELINDYGVTSSSSIEVIVK